VLVTNRLFNSVDTINSLTVLLRKTFPFYSLINFKFLYFLDLFRETKVSRYKLRHSLFGKQQRANTPRLTEKYAHLKISAEENLLSTRDPHSIY